MDIWVLGTLEHRFLYWPKWTVSPFSGGSLLMSGPKESSLTSSRYGLIEPLFGPGKHGVSGRGCAIIATVGAWHGEQAV